VLSPSLIYCAIAAFDCSLNSKLAEFKQQLKQLYQSSVNSKCAVHELRDTYKDQLQQLTKSVQQLAVDVKNESEKKYFMGKSFELNATSAPINKKSIEYKKLTKAIQRIIDIICENHTPLWILIPVHVILLHCILLDEILKQSSTSNQDKFIRKLIYSHITDLIINMMNCTQEDKLARKVFHLIIDDWLIKNRFPHCNKYINELMKEAEEEWFSPNKKSTSKKERKISQKIKSQSSTATINESSTKDLKTIEAMKLKIKVDADKKNDHSRLIKEINGLRKENMMMRQQLNAILIQTENDELRSVLNKITQENNTTTNVISRMTTIPPEQNRCTIIEKPSTSAKRLLTFQPIVL
jgi:hypothetical protein